MLITSGSQRVKLRWAKHIFRVQKFFTSDIQLFKVVTMCQRSDQEFLQIGKYFCEIMHNKVVQCNIVK